MTNTEIRLIRGLVIVGAFMATHQAQAEITTINCNTAVHLADFTACAKNKAIGHGAGTFWFVTFNTAKSTAVKVTGVRLSTGTFVYAPIAYKSSGVQAVTDADLATVNTTLITTLAKAGGIPNLNIDPDQVFSLINVEFPEVLTRSIDSNLLSLFGPLYVDITPVGTIISVTCPGDGTNAQFVRISLSGSVQWEMKPGTLKNKAGQFIDPATGKVIGPAVNNVGAPGFLGALPVFPGIGLNPIDWQYWSALPGGTVTVGDICLLDQPC